jgi:hypothetical protein
MAPATQARRSSSSASAKPSSVLELPARWKPLRLIAAQHGYANSPHRFNVVPAGRRSGKTEHLKRKIVRHALGGGQHRPTHGEAPRYFAGAPTRPQAKQIYWDDLKSLTRPWWDGAPSETELSITLVTGAEIVVFGMDKPQRFEGQPWDGGGLDEFANMRPEAWQMNVRPALSDRNGWCDLVGVPEGRNHYYEIYQKAVARMKDGGPASEWGAFTWYSSAVLPPAEIAAAREDLDPLSFAQEYEASFLNFEGRVYYGFTDENQARLRDLYNPAAPLILCLDFNVAPGVGVICQTLRLPITGQEVTGVIGEVWIEDNSNTELVCRRFLTDWGAHQGLVEVYGDATGGSRGTAKVQGSDWDLARQILTRGDPARGLPGLGESRVRFMIPPANPRERARVNAVNARLCTIAGERRLLVDASAAPHVVKDLEGVQVVKGGSGEIDKKKDPRLTHISDALGYYIVARYPIAPAGVGSTLLTV